MNKSEISYSDEYLNAFVDGQLGSEEQDRVFKSLQEDVALSRRVCEMNKLRQMVQFAYVDVPKASRRQPGKSRLSRYAGQGLAAGLLLLVGAGVGWFGNATQPTGHEKHLVANIQKVTDAIAVPHRNVLLHLDSDDAGKLATALDEAETLLTAFDTDKLNYNVEVLVNDGGMDLLRSDLTPFPERIRDLSSRFDNVNFMACGNAIRRLQAMGVKVQLVPDAKVAPSALEQIIKRLDEGWIYMKV